MGAELQFRKVKMFWKWIADDGFTSVNLLNATEMYT